MRTATMPDTCTGLHFYNFVHDGGATTSYMEDQKRQIKTQLDQAKTGRYVNVFAFLIGTQEASKKQLEEFGFVCAADHHNYKYPDSSKRLYMMVKDMNDWEVVVEKKAAVNTFAAAPQAAVDVADYELAPNLRGSWDVERLITHLMRYGSQPRAAAIRDAIRNQYLIPRAPQAAPVHAPTTVERNQRIIAQRPNVTAHHGLNFAAERHGIRHRTLGMYMATREADGTFVTPAGNAIEHPFPLNEWVDIPNQITTCPPALVGCRSEVRLYRGRSAFYGPQDGWAWDVTGQDHQIVSVRRVS